MTFTVYKKSLEGNLVNEYTPLNNLYKNIGGKKSLSSFTSQKLNFDLEHPVDIEILPSYDGSVNLILNDDKNIPRIINSGFKTLENSKYKIINRIGSNSTNIYDEDLFESDTSLYFNYSKNPIIEYLGMIKGELPVGLYSFYINYADEDGNESDYVAESNILPIFIGEDGNPKSIDGGIKNQNSNKGVRFKVKNIESNYNYIVVSYIRYYADYQLNRLVEFKKITHKYNTNNQDNIIILILGTETTETLDPNILNISKFNPKSVLTQTQCKNMLFFGNITKNSDEYALLKNYSLRIIPSIELNLNMHVDTLYSSYIDNSYYKSNTMYSKVGYFNEEYYRFGVVYLYENGLTSSVYNILGATLNENTNISLIKNNLNKIDLDKDIIENENNFITNYNDIYNFNSDYSTFNTKGVCKISLNDTSNEDNIIYFRFKIPENLPEKLKELGIRGLFFVRQKRLPNRITQCLILNVETISRVPLLKNENGKNIILGFLSKYGNNNAVRVLQNPSIYTENNNDPLCPRADNGGAYIGICPDFLLNLPYYNNIFNGSKFELQQYTTGTTYKKDTNNIVYYSVSSSESNGYASKNLPRISVSICSVTEEVPTVALENKIFNSTAGKAEEAYRFETFGSVPPDDIDNSKVNYVRGKYSPYLAILCDGNSSLQAGEIYNIYNENSLDDIEEFKIRMNINEPFYSISDRYNFEDILGNSLTCYRGDCYFNVFTYRVNRNFNDPSLPNNDKIIDPKTWEDNYTNIENFSKISRSDINAVKLGLWVTFKVKSDYNYALRSVDESFVAEKALMGAPRSFYPRSSLFNKGENKMPDSYLYNDAYRSSVGFKCYFTLDDVKYLKDTYSNRIQYSEVSILDSYKNNYRESLSTYFRDYSQEYGGISKLINYEGHLLVIFEHAICLAVINERILTGTGEGEPVFINTHNVLPEELTVISDTYGTLWPETVIKSENGFVYGLDTISKKIWRVKGNLIEIISDLKVNSFLSTNIPETNHKYSPYIGKFNIKTHYNNNKKDIMFTCYWIDNNNKILWNLCYNENLNLFVTFYSWIPLYSENIDTRMYSFNYKENQNLLWVHLNGLPCNWYNELHPFEFEFVVNDKIGQLKIFSNLVLISNKAEPQSFHFEIEGDNYDFSSDKRTMYFRQEATKKLFNSLGSDILYDGYYTDVVEDKYTYELYYRTLLEQKLLNDENQLRKAYSYNGRDINDNCIGVDKVYPVYSHGLVQQVKSTIFPLYYERIDKDDDIYHTYREMLEGISTNYDFKNLSGSEIKWNKKLNLFNIVTHIKNSPIDLVGRLRGNSRYKEGKWDVQIPSIIFMLKNEEWPTITVPQIDPQTGIQTDTQLKLPPIVINSSYVPNDLSNNRITGDKLPNIYAYNKTDNITDYINVEDWTYRKETKIRDKWVKIRVRYSGKNLAVIHSLITLYNISYS